MIALDSLQALINEVANRSEISTEVASVLPIYEFRVLGSQYKELADSLRATNNPELIKYIFVAGSYQKGVRADFSTITRLIRNFSATPEITANAELAQVYARLATISGSLSYKSQVTGEKMWIAADRVYGILSSTQLFNELNNAKIFFKVREKAEVSSTKAKFVVDIDATSSQTDSSIFKRIITNSKIAGIDKLAKDINKELYRANVSEITNRFLTSVDAQFRGQVAPNSLQTALKEFNTRKLDIANANFKTAAQEARGNVLNLEAIIQQATQAESQQTTRRESGTTSSASLLAILNAGLHEAIKNRMKTTADPISLKYLRYGGGFGSSYRTTEGRFARTAKVTSVTTSPSGKFTDIRYDYMKYPYETFAPLGHMYTGRGRDVEYLIKMAITDLARNLITTKLKIMPA